MPKIPPLKGKEIIAVFLRLGFFKHHQTGSHVQMRHSIKLHLRVTVPRHDNFDLPPFVVGSILKQAEISRDEFLNFLKES
jgi:predicted RNA binding protein YcfA (HicA-like mRNA interferase family)